jgi:hypothetical protein
VKAVVKSKSSVPPSPDGMREHRQFIKPLQQLPRPQGMILVQFSIVKLKHSPHANVCSCALSLELVHLEIQKDEALYL